MVIMQNKETNETKRVLKTFHSVPFIMVPVLLLILNGFMLNLEVHGLIKMFANIGVFLLWIDMSYSDKAQIKQLKVAGFAVTK
ncbi:hypothetical protein HOH30_00115 [Candidatus Woesearchaeota archaeon]|jgi:hypothetical protein|nr:hypothetical protein [Candidatus Woesearchaeota archaeon]